MRLLFILLLLIPAFARAEEEKPPVVIAVVGPMTGSAAAFGRSIEQGARLAMARLIMMEDGAWIEHRVLDDRGSVGDAVKIARELGKDEKVAIVIGHFNSTCAIAANAEYERAGLVSLSPGATHEAVTKNRPWAFRLVPADDV
jgi:branched-chain amino acid transport system substrate-binding protein